MKVVILAGGKGTRIHGVVENVPKPLVHIGEKPIIEHVMDIYTKHGIKDFILCLGHKSWQIKEHFMNYDNRINDMQIRVQRTGGCVEVVTESLDYYNYKYDIVLAETGENNGTASRLLQIRKYLKKDEEFMVTYSDGVSNIDINELLKFHNSHNKNATITGVYSRNKFGTLLVQHYEISGQLLPQVYSFEEKPSSDQLINAGFFIFENNDEFWKHFDNNPNLSLEKDILPKLANDNQLMMYHHTGFWHCMDNYAEWQELNEIWNKNGKW